MRNSVAMCTYNGAPWLRAQLDSIASQTRPPDELVVCDDRSNDSTVTILRDFASSAPFPVRVHVNDSNLGAYANFSQAMGLCDGDLIFLSDQDDVWLPDRVARTAAVFESSPQVGAVLGNAEVVDEALHPLGYTLWDVVWLSRKEPELFRQGRGFEALLKQNVATGATLAFRADFRKLVLPVPALKRCAHDGWLALLISAVAEIAILPDPVIRYRLHARNVVGTRKRNVREQIALAREQVRSEVFRDDAQVFAAARDRLAAAQKMRPRLKQKNIEQMLEGKIRHMTNRHEMPRSFLRRLPAILRELRAGAYSKYSLGWKSVAQDLFLR